MNIESEFDALTDYLERIQNDPALVANFRARYPTMIRIMRESILDQASGPNLDRLMPFDDLVALQFTVFDNGDRKRGSRWGGAVRAYYDKPINWLRPSWKANVRFIAPDKLEKELRQNKAISPATAAILAQMHGLGDDWFVGMMNMTARGSGTHFFEEHAACIRFDGDEIVDGWLHRPDASEDGRMMQLPAFVRHDAAGEPLTGKAHSMSRFSEDETLTAWNSGIGDRV
jgi:hypothetical protein